MFGIFDVVEDAVSNVIDVGLGVMTLGEYGNFSQRTVSKMVADGIEIYVISDFFGASEDIVRGMVDD